MKELDANKNYYKSRCSESLMNATKFIEYNHKTGEITRNDRKNSNGSVDYYGYLIIKIKGVQWKAHRLAWAKYYGESPKYVIDHINGNKLDNSINNLRDVKQRENVLNTKRKPNKSTGVIGVYLDNTKGLKKKYATKYKGKTYRFYTIEEAKIFKLKNK